MVILVILSNLVIFGNAGYLGNPYSNLVILGNPGYPGNP